jgi:two-component system, OmpR family, response regulator
VSRILIAEDERRLSSFLEKGLRSVGYTPTVAADGRTAALLARDEDFDLLILDLGLPGQDGLEVLRAVRGRGERIPILVLTARHRVGDTVAALDGGADDYLTKPFVFDELLARVRARIRATPGDAGSHVVESAGVALDLRTRRVLVGDLEVELTAREFSMLETFLRHPDEALSREQLISHVWGHDVDVASNVVDVYVSSLRRKLGPEHFETVRGLGYRMRRA